MLLFLGLGQPNAKELDALNSKKRKIEDMYERTFLLAAELGREESLFGMTREEKNLYDTTQEYVQAVDEAEVLGTEANRSPADFFVSFLITLYVFPPPSITFYFSYLHTHGNVKLFF